MLLSDHSALLREWLLNAFRNSVEYRVDQSTADDLLILVDRVLAACRNHPEVGKVDEALAALDELVRTLATGNTPRANAQALTWLQHHLEHWFKAVWWLSNRSSYETAKEEDAKRREKGQTRRFNLFASVIGLDLLTNAEANTKTEDVQQISEAVRRLIFTAKTVRNAGHDLERVDVDAGPVLMAVICAPVLKHNAVLASLLRGLVLRPFSIPAVRRQTLHSIAEARRSHLERFGGRTEWIRDLPDRMAEVSERGGYLLLVGPEGQGKTALASRLSEVLREKRPLDAGAPKLVRDAPWMPGVIFHLGKQSRSVHEITELILAQGNALLLRPVPFLADDREARLPVAFSISDPSIPTGVDEAPRVTAPDMTFAPRLLRPLDDYQSRLFWLFERLREERGGCMVIIDGLDEITRRGDELAFLPPVVPRGCVIILTVRAHLGLDGWLKSNLQYVEELALGNLSRPEIPLVTGVPEDLPGGTRFNDEVSEKTGGWAYMVSAVADEVRRNGGRWEAVKLVGLVDTFLDAQAHRWVDEGDVLRSLLPMLASFEPCSPVSIDSLQAYLHYGCGVDRARFEVSSELRKVGSQLEGVQAGKVKLAQSVLAHYVREQFLSRRDYQAVHNAILNWVVEDDDVESAVVAQLFSLPSVAGERRRPLDFTEKLCQGLEAKGARKRLRLLGFAAPETSEGRTFSAKCWRRAAQLGDSPAAFGLALRLLQGTKRGGHNTEAETLLREAAARGHARSMGLLGDHLLRLPDATSRENGLEWLRRATASGEPVAAFHLGSYLLEGTPEPEAKAEAERVLRSACGANPRVAVMLAQSIERGLLQAKDGSEPLDLWRTAAEAGDAYGMFFYAVRLLGKAEALPQYRDEGEKYLKRAAADGFLPAVRSLGWRMILGQFGSVEEGRDWLLRGIEKDDKGSKALLGDAALRFEVPGVARDRALTLLNTAATAGDTFAMRRLGDRLIDGDRIQANVADGVEWMERAVTAGDVVAMRLFGIRLIEGDSIPPAPARGAELLERAVAADSVDAMLELGRRLLDGDGIAGDESRGFALLQRAATRKPLEAHLAMGRWMLNSSSNEQQKQGKELLRPGAEAGHEPSMSYLGNYLVTHTDSVEEGEQLLRGAADKDFAPAMSMLGLFAYQRGDLSQAGRWFAQAHARGEANATNNIAYMVRRGEVPRDQVAEPLDELLRESVREKSVFATINLALATAIGFHCEADWRKAEQLVDSLKPGRDIVGAADWWHALAKKGEAEGHVVLAWLVGRRLVEDPDGWAPPQRYAAARAGRWPVPSDLSPGQSS